MLSIGYIFSSLGALRDVNGYEKSQEDDDFLDDRFGIIYALYIATLMVGFGILICSIYLLYGSTKVSIAHLVISLEINWMFFTANFEIYLSIFARSDRKRILGATFDGYRTLGPKL